MPCSSLCYIFQSLETLDNGKPYLDSVADMEHSSDVLKYYAGWCDKICGKTIPVSGKHAIKILLCKPCLYETIHV